MSEPIFISDNGTRREATADEAAYIVVTQQEMQKQSAAQEQAAAESAAARVSALAKLKALGLTDAEVAALVGG